MNKKYLLTGCVVSFCILILILDGKTAMTGAQIGVDLCIRTVIPSLFPFFLLSILLTNALSGNSLSFLRPIEMLLGIPEGTESILLTGFLGGYPTGAKSLATAYHSNQIKKEDADRMLSFCSNAGPAFLFGMVSPLFPNRAAAFILWGIHIVSALLVAILHPSSQSTVAISQVKKKLTIAEAMHSSILVMSTVCGWVVVFRVILAFLERWFLWLFPTVVQVVICGILELSNGCCALTGIVDSQLRFVICSGMLAWGGLCVVLQTRSVTNGLSIYAYLKGKLLQTLFSLLISASIVLNIWLPVTALLLFLALLVQKMQKRGSNPSPVGV